MVRHKQKRPRLMTPKELTSFSLPYEIEPPAPELSALPDLALLAIFKQLPTMEQIRQRRVCRRWYDLLTMVAHNKTMLSLYRQHTVYSYEAANADNSLREQLDLMRFFEMPEQPVADLVFGMAADRYEARKWIRVGKTPEEDWVFEKKPKLKWPVLEDDAAVAYQLPQRFPAIKELTIFDANIYGDHIAYLLYAWASTLETVRIVECQSACCFWKVILPMLNCLPKLRHLSLYIMGTFTWDCTILPQLTTFHFGCYDYYADYHQSSLYRFLSQLNPSQLQRFSFGFFAPNSRASPFVHWNLRQMIEEKPTLAAKLTKLKFPELSDELLHYLAEHFHSLTCLDIALPAIGQLTYLDVLARLPALAELTIRSNERPYSASPIAGSLTADVIATLPSNQTVTKLTIFDMQIHTEVIAHMWPNARMVTFRCRGDENPVDYAQANNQVDFNGFDWEEIDVENRIGARGEVRQQHANDDDDEDQDEGERDH